MGKLEDKIIYKKIKDIIGEFQFFLNHPNKGFDILQTSQKIHDLLRQELLSYRREIIKEILKALGEMEDEGENSATGRGSVTYKNAHAIVRNEFRKQILDKLKRKLI